VTSKLPERKRNKEEANIIDEGVEIIE